MANFFHKLTAVCAVTLGIAVSSNPANAQTAYAISGGGFNLISFDVTNPSVVTTIGAFSGGGSGFAFGVPALDTLDFRPANGLLYGYNDVTDSLYTVDTATAALTLVGSGGIGTNTNVLDIDFNPSIDRIRIVTATNQNLVVNPNTGALQLDATPLNYPGGTPIPRVVANAYAGNVTGSNFPFPQYAIDVTANRLVGLDNNNGTLTGIGSGLGVDADDFTSFDIFTSITGVNSAYAIIDTTVGGSAPTLYSINLTTGAATGGVLLGGGASQVTGLAIRPTPSVAVVPEAGTLPLLMGGVMTAGLGIVVRRRVKK